MKKPIPIHSEPVDASPGLLLKSEIASKCRVSIRTVDKWLREGRIPAIKIKRAIRFQWAAVEAALAKFRKN